MVTGTSEKRLLTVVCLTLLLPVFAFALQDGFVRTPPMGFNTWNYFACNNINEGTMLTAAKEFCQKRTATWGTETKQWSLKEAGYVYLNMDDCWHGSRNSTTQAPQYDATRFQHGFKWLSDSVHNMGLKLGIYSCAGTNTCAGRFGSNGKDSIDAWWYAEWGMDYLKEDWCNVPNADMNEAGVKKLYGRMRDRLDEQYKRTGRKIVFSLCSWGNYQEPKYGDELGHLWRTTTDIKAGWGDNVYTIAKTSTNGGASSMAKAWTYQKPGGFNDADMMECGNGSLTAAENQSHFSIWCIMGSPLLLGNPLNQMSDALFSILSNPEVIALDQDSLGYGGHLIRTAGSIDIWAKKLASPDTVKQRKWGVCVLNTGTGSATGTVNWADIGETDASSEYTIRDLVNHKDLSTNATGSYTTGNLGSHASETLLFTRNFSTGATSGTPTAAEKCLRIMSRGKPDGIELYIPSANSTVQMFSMQGKVVASFTAAVPSWYRVSSSPLRGSVVVRVKSPSGVMIRTLVLSACTETPVFLQRAEYFFHGGDTPYGLRVY